MEIKMKFSQMLNEDDRQFKQFLNNLKSQTDMIEYKFNSNSSKEDVFNSILIMSRVILRMVDNYARELKSYEVPTQYKKIVDFVKREL